MLEVAILDSLVLDPSPAVGRSGCVPYLVAKS